MDFKCFIGEISKLNDRVSLLCSTALDGVSLDEKSSIKACFEISYITGQISSICDEALKVVSSEEENVSITYPCGDCLLDFVCPHAYTDLACKNADTDKKGDTK